VASHLPVKFSRGSHLQIGKHQRTHSARQFKSSFRYLSPNYIRRLDSSLLSYFCRCLQLIFVDICRLIEDIYHWLILEWHITIMCSSTEQPTCIWCDSDLLLVLKSFSLFLPAQVAYVRFSHNPPPQVACQVTSVMFRWKVNIIVN
jgi:hypothetical protein